MLRAVIVGLGVVVSTGVAVAPAAAQRGVVLRIRPPLGDTLRMQLEQQFDMSTEDAAGAPTGGMSGSMRIWTRAVPLRRVGSSTDVLSVTDSVSVVPPSAAMWQPLRNAKRELEGRTVRLTIAEDGEMTLSGGEHSGVVASGVGLDLPSVLPRTAVRVGQSWTRNITVPLSVTERETAMVRTTLRLDSLGRDGGMAYLSMRGVVSHDHAQHSSAMHGSVTGTLVGTIELDRRLGWITGSRTALAITSLMKPAGKAPVHLRVRVTQLLRALVDW